MECFGEYVDSVGCVIRWFGDVDKTDYRTWIDYWVEELCDFLTISSHRLIVGRDINQEENER